MCNMKKKLVTSLLLLMVVSVSAQNTERRYWLDLLLKMCTPIYQNLSCNQLRKNMPIEAVGKQNNIDARSKVTHLEAVGRSFAGIAPWLNLPEDDTEEGLIRKQYVTLVIKSIENSVDPSSPDNLSFDGPINQPLVDAAYFAEGLLRSKDTIWPKLNKKTQARVIAKLKSSRKIKPMEKNWLMFSAIVEAALLQFTDSCDMQPINHALQNHEKWYKGDGWYGDGSQLHFDYYNSFVIHPMLMDVLSVLKNNGRNNEMYQREILRFTRMAQQQERLIAADGTYPIIGSSICYRTGAFHLLAQAALMHLLPRTVTPSQVRSALTAVYHHVFIPESFNPDGWLVLGVCGHQASLADKYVSTGSLYMATLSFLPLGLAADDPFWTGPYTEWTNKKVWNQCKDVRRDEALRDDNASSNTAVDVSFIDKGLEVAREQCMLMAQKMKDSIKYTPRSYTKNGKFQMVNMNAWTSGFFPGTLWYLYEDFKDDSLLYYANHFTGSLDGIQYIQNNHDIGFMINCSYGNGYRITQNPEYKRILIQGAKSLSTRFSPIVGCTRSWGKNTDMSSFVVIIDNMMNLELLEKASHLSDNVTFDNIARSHANTTMKNHFRKDYSCYHVVEYDPATGNVIKRRTHQGFSDESSWARGQGWALYGFTMRDRETVDKKYLNQAQHIAEYLLANQDKFAEGVPIWDFNAPSKWPERDASSAAIMASAFLQLSRYVPDSLGRCCQQLAILQLKTLSSPAYLAKVGENGNFILMHSVGNRNKNKEVDMPLTYADYYYIEALLLLKKMIKNKDLYS